MSASIKERFGGLVGILAVVALWPIIAFAFLVARLTSWLEVTRATSEFDVLGRGTLEANEDGVVLSAGSRKERVAFAEIERALMRVRLDLDADDPYDDDRILEHLLVLHRASGKALALWLNDREKSESWQVLKVFPEHNIEPEEKPFVRICPPMFSLMVIVPGVFAWGIGLAIWWSTR